MVVYGDYFTGVICCVCVCVCVCIQPVEVANVLIST